MKSIYIHIGEESGHTVVVDDKIADRLTKDEALGVVASLLFGGSIGPIFVRSVEQIQDIAKERGRQLALSDLDTSATTEG